MDMGVDEFFREIQIFKDLAEGQGYIKKPNHEWSLR